MFKDFDRFTGAYARCPFPADAVREARDLVDNLEFLAHKAADVPPWSQAQTLGEALLAIRLLRARLDDLESFRT